MRTLIDYITFTAGMLAFCGLLAWIESVPLPDSAMDHFFAAGEVALTIIENAVR